MAVPNGGTSGPFPAGSPGYLGYGSSGADAVRPALVRRFERSRAGAQPLWDVGH